MIFEKEFLFGDTPFHVACEWDQIQCVRLFSNALDSSIKHNSSKIEGKGVTSLSPIEMFNNKNQTPIDIAYAENAQESYYYLCARYNIKKKWFAMCTVF